MASAETSNDQIDEEDDVAPLLGEWGPDELARPQQTLRIVRGDHAPALQGIVEELQQAAKLASDSEQKAAFEKLAMAFRSGSMRQYDIAGALFEKAMAATEGLATVAMGFTDLDKTTGDPMEKRALWEGSFVLNSDEHPDGLPLYRLGKPHKQTPQDKISVPPHVFAKEGQGQLKLFKGDPDGVIESSAYRLAGLRQLIEELSENEKHHRAVKAPVVRVRARSRYSKKYGVPWDRKRDPPQPAITSARSKSKGHSPSPIRQSLRPAKGVGSWSPPKPVRRENGVTPTIEDFTTPPKASPPRYRPNRS